MMLDESDELKFSTSTPNRLTSANLRVWATVGPTPKQIVEDVLKVIPSWTVIQKNKGDYVDAVNRNGKRKGMQTSAIESDSSAPNKKGGARTRKLPEDDYGDARLHANAQKAVDDRLKKSTVLKHE
jgi:hypothetical protein